MNSDFLEGKWQKVRSVIKKQWGEVTNDEPAKVEGRYDQLVGQLQEKYSHTRRKAEKEVNSRLQALRGYGEQLQTTTGEVVEDVDQVITQYRWVLLGATLLLGLAVGFWLKSLQKQQTPFSPFP